MTNWFKSGFQWAATAAGCVPIPIIGDAAEVLLEGGAFISGALDPSTNIGDEFKEAGARTAIALVPIPGSSLGKVAVGRAARYVPKMSDEAIAVATRVVGTGVDKALDITGIQAIKGFVATEAEEVAATSPVNERRGDAVNEQATPPQQASGLTDQSTQVPEATEPPAPAPEPDVTASATIFSRLFEFLRNAVSKIPGVGGTLATMLFGEGRTDEASIVDAGEHTEHTPQATRSASDVPVEEQELATLGARVGQRGDGSVPTPPPTQPGRGEHAPAQRV